MSTSYLFELPVELLIHILSFCHVYDLYSCLLVNQSLSNLIKSSTVLQYTIESQLAGVDDQPNRSYSLQQRLELLKRREEAWLYLRVDFKERIKVNWRPSGIYDLTGGMCLLGDSRNSSLSDTHSVNYVALPSSKIQETEWCCIDISRRIVDIGLSVYEHDLIAIMTARKQESCSSPSYITEITLLNLSTKKPHVHAKHPTISVDETDIDRGRLAIGIEIVGDYLALVTSYPTAGDDVPDKFYVFNWKEGSLKMIHNAAHGSYTGLVFLSTSVIMIPDVKTATFETWKINLEDGLINHICTLRLPRLSSEFAIRSISCRGEPNPYVSMSIPSAFRPAVFYSPSEAIVTVNIHLWSQSNPFDRRTFTMIAHRHALLSAATKGRSDIPWAEWGPPITRWLPADDMSTRWITVAVGQRFAIITNNARFDPFPVILLDFNPHHVKRYRQQAESSRKMWVVSDDDTLDHFGMFDEPVMSSLPYLATASRQNFTYDGVLMDEERLLGIMTNDMEVVKTIEVLHFGASDMTSETEEA